MNENVIRNIERYCESNNMSISALEKKCEIGNGTIRGWKKSSPRLESLEKISKTTGISINNLIK